MLAHLHRTNFARLQKTLPQVLARHERPTLALVLLLGLLIRLPFAPIDFRTSVDMELFQRWARMAQTLGLADIYSSARADYPPLSLYLMAGAAWLADQLPETVDVEGRGLTTLIKLAPMLADVLTAIVIVWAFRFQSPATKIWAGTAYLFNPGVWYVSSHWGQTDAIYTLFLVLSVVALEIGAVVPAWLAYALALTTKLQSIATAPLLLAATIKEYGFHGLARGSLAAVGVLAITAAPWWLSGRLSEVLAGYQPLANQAPRVDVSAYNLWYLLLLGKVHMVDSAMYPLGMPFTFQSLGILMYGAFTALCIILTIRSRLLPLAGAALSFGMFMLMTQIHERHMFPVLAFLILACIKRPRLWWGYAVLSATFFFNLVTIAPFTTFLGTNLVAAQPDTVRVLVLKGLSLVVAAINTVVLIWLVVELGRRDSDKSRLLSVPPLPKY